MFCFTSPEMVSFKALLTGAVDEDVQTGEINV